MTGITKDNDIGFRKSFFFVSGKRLNMMNMPVGDMLAGRASFEKVFLTYFADVTPSNKDSFSETTVFAGFSNSSGIKRNSAFPVVAIFPIASSSFGKRHSNSLFFGKFAASQIFASSPSRNVVLGKMLMNKSIACANHVANLAHGFVILYVFFKQKVFGYISSFYAMASVLWKSFWNSKHSTESINSSPIASKMFCNFTNRHFFRNIQIPKFFFGDSKSWSECFI